MADTIVDSNVTWQETHVAPGDRLILDETKDVLIEMARASLVVENGGEIISTPNPGVTHRILFDTDEYHMTGSVSGVDPCTQYGDPGLWIHGKATMIGSARVPWLRLAVQANAGDQTITLNDLPCGWHVGQELAIAPQEFGDFATEVRVITGITGNVVTLDRPLARAHRMIPFPAHNLVMGSRVVNMSNNVQVGGLKIGSRTHIHICDISEPQNFQFMTIQFAGAQTGPVKGSQPGAATGFVGRYPLHFHKNGDNSVGSIVNAVVTRDSGNHAFVPHSSNGIMMTDCYAHETYDAAYWWDKTERTNRLSWIRCAAGGVHFDPEYQGYANLTGFWLQGAEGNKFLDCEVWGVIGNDTSNGIAWPEVTETPDNIRRWDAQRGYSHNNKRWGIFTWQNNNQPHTIIDHLTGMNGAGAIRDGAYRHGYKYQNCEGYGDNSGIEIFSSSLMPPNPTEEYTGMVYDFAGKAVNGIVIHEHGLPGQAPALVQGTFKGYTGALLKYVESPTKEPGQFDVSAVGINGPITPADCQIVQMHPASTLRLLNPDGTMSVYTAAGGWH